MSASRFRFSELKHKATPEQIERAREDLPKPLGFRRRPVYERYLRRKHHMLDDEQPSEAEVSDALALLEDSWDDELRQEALDILRIAYLVGVEGSKRGE